MAIQLNTSSLYRQFSSLLKRRICATMPFCLMRCESCSHVRNSNNKGAQVQAPTSWVGLTRMAVLPASSTACQQKSTAGVLARWTSTSTVLYSYGVNQPFASSLLLCSPDCITSETKVDNHLWTTSYKVADQLPEHRWEAVDPFNSLFQHPSVTLSTCETRWLLDGYQVFVTACVTEVLLQTVSSWNLS